MTFSLPPLWDAIVCGKQDAVIHLIPELPEHREQPFQPEGVVVLVGEPEHVLKQERARLRLAQDPQVMVEEISVGILSAALVLEPVAAFPAAHR